MLSQSAWEALGRPERVAFGYDELGYYVVPALDGDLHGVKVHKGRRISTGVLAQPLAGSRFPLHIALEPVLIRDMMNSGPMLRFGSVETA